MAQEDKELLLKDLCARLPYRVKVKTPYNDAILIGLTKRKGFKKDEYYIDAITDKQTYPVRYIQPYLRPMSSMTWEEKEEYYKLQEEVLYSSGRLVTDNINDMVDWLNAHHFDYHRLIEKGLAIEAPEEMYK